MEYLGGIKYNSFIIRARSSMVEQHPFKVMVERSNRSGLTSSSSRLLRDRLTVGHLVLAQKILGSNPSPAA